MNKLKTCKSAAKRVKIKKKNLVRKKAFKSHLMGSKSKKRIRRLSKKDVIHIADKSTFLLMNPYK